MTAKRKVQLRSCSICGLTGHNRARCSVNTMATKVNKSSQPRQKKELLKTVISKNATERAIFGISEKNKSNFVSINTKSTNFKSPHIIDLKKKENSIWDKVNIYQEKSLLLEKRVEVNFGEMVKVANAVKTKNRTQDTKDKVKIKKEKIKLPDFSFQFVFDFSNILKNNFQSAIFNFQSLFQSFNYKKLVYSTIVLLIVFSLPFPALGYYRSVKDTSVRVVEASTNAFLSLQSSTVAAIGANIPQAQFDLNAALVSFGEANSMVEKEHQVLQYVAGLLPVIGKQVTSRQHLLVAGQHLALGNTYLVKGIKEMEENKDIALTDRFKILADHLHSSIPQYREALANLSAVNISTVPVEYQESFQEFRLLFATFIDDMNDLSDLSSSLDLVFGSDQLKRYLLVFQNNNELRPTGGFMGSFAVLDIQKGKIMNLDIPGGGTYDLQGQLDEYVKPPLPLQLANKRWEFQDANWFPDFPASAQKMEWFYEHGRGTTVDGVIAINASVLERLLTVLGPVENEKNNLTIASDNALANLQYKVEVDYDKTNNKPKEVLSDLAPQFLNQMGNLEVISAVRLLTQLHESLKQKEIQIYFNDASIQNRMAQFGWTGAVTSISDNQDFLQVINTNIQGQKSDAKIEQTIEHQVVVELDGSITDTVIIERKHTGVPGEMFYGVNNVDYLRIYVPQGSELLEAGGFTYPPEEAFYVPENWYKDDGDLKNNEKQIGIDKETGTIITEEFGKTAFGNWSMVQPGHTTKVYFVYKLPFKVFSNQDKIDSTLKKWEKALIGQKQESSRYSLVVQKQSGIDSNFSTRVIYPDNWSPVWQENEGLNLASNGAEFEIKLTTDEVMGVVMEKNN